MWSWLFPFNFSNRDLFAGSSSVEHGGPQEGGGQGEADGQEGEEHW